MSVRSSELRRLLPARARDEKGAILVIAAVVMLALLATSGLAVDVGQVYITRSKLSAVADAGALAGARIVRLGESRARTAVLNMAAANGLATGEGGAAVTVGFARDAKGRQTVSVSLSQPQKLLFAGMVGIKEVSVSAAATATGPPVDLVMVIDQSGSLDASGAWDDVQRAAKTFVGFFGDSYDKMSLVSFQSLGAMRNQLSSTFRYNIQYSIDRMDSFGSTNMAEGLRKARDEMQSGRTREGSLKAVIFFTDGWPNTFRTSFKGIPLIVGTRNWGTTLLESEAHYMKNPDSQPVNYNVPWEGDCDDDPRKSTAVCPWTLTPAVVVDSSRTYALRHASEMREAGIYVYTIGMKDSDAKLDPDMAFLRQMANDNGVASSSQPQGKAYYAPSTDELQTIFTRVATDIMVHLVQ